MALHDQQREDQSVMGRDSGPVWVPNNFLALPDEQSRLESSRVVVLPVPYDSTTSFRTGAREGPRAIIEASYNLEDYDPELDVDVSLVGIHTTPYLEPHMEGPRLMVDRVRDTVRTFLQSGEAQDSERKIVALLGGEHSLSTGHVQVLADYYSDMSVLFLDAHGDLRNTYMGTEWGHASVARRISEICNVVQVGVRSLSQEEKEFAESGDRVKTFRWPPAYMEDRDTDRLDGADGVSRATAPRDLAEHVVRGLAPNVYISVDMDVFDPSIMPAVGTPEPGGMGWYQVTGLLRSVAEKRNIIGFDVTELCPREGPAACSYTAAKLVYKLIAYSTLLPKQEGSSTQTADPR